jgi:hypothetical protein
LHLVARAGLERAAIFGPSAVIPTAIFPIYPATLRAARVHNLGRAVFTTDAAVSEWLSKPDQSLGNMAPLDLLDTDFGAREVENLLRALAYGQFV